MLHTLQSSPAQGELIREGQSFFMRGQTQHGPCAVNGESCFRDDFVVGGGVRRNNAWLTLHSERRADE